MQRLRLVLALIFLALASIVSVARAAGEVCQKPYVVPYAEQCGFAYRSLQKDTSPSNLSAAFNACGRAQDAAVSCVTTHDRNFHAIALGALYQDVTRQAGIALFAQQFGVAQALIREKLQILDVVAQDAKPGDTSVARERKAAKIELADAGAGFCTQAAIAGAGDTSALAQAKKYPELATLLRGKSVEYEACARKAPTLYKRAYLEYVGLVALEESSRAAEAAGETDLADRGYRSCIAGAKRIVSYARAPVTTYLTTVRELCAGRLSGKYAVDQPTPLDAPAPKGFHPLTLPKN